MEEKTTEGTEPQQQALVSFVYSIDHEVSDLVAVAEALRARGIVMLPSVGTSYMHADANAWESPNEQVAIRTRKTGDYRPRTIMLPGEYTSLAEYTDALIRAVLDEPEQCASDGCTNSEDGGGSGCCSSACFSKHDDYEEACEAQAAVTMAVTSGSDLVFLWSCLRHADEFAAELEASFGMVPVRAARGSQSMECGHQGRRPMISLLVDEEDDVPSDAGDIDMNEVRAGGAR
ncbi:hypothetical protein [Glycomyces sp. NPDC021274]|uniref:hypothetical protein n=1 Tax=Glycomyces sp. NPDC021274 TaxID=3155120 RepID=UPI0033F4DE05